MVDDDAVKLEREMKGAISYLALQSTGGLYSLEISTPPDIPHSSPIDIDTLLHLRPGVLVESGQW